MKFSIRKLGTFEYFISFFNESENYTPLKEIV